jgi:hypothetical protein
MQWGEVKDRIVEGRRGKTRCWLLLNPKGKVHSIYIKIDEVSKFLPEDEYEETLEGAKLKAEIELERFQRAQQKPKPSNKTRV